MVMKTRKLGKQGPPVSVVGIGTWQMENDDPRQATSAIAASIDAGVTHVDTAEMYGDGEVERLVGKAIAGRRDEVFLVSKVLPQNASRRGTIEACERSLERLETDRLDLYLLHWAGEHPLEDTIAAFEQLVADGKIVRYGVSNFDVDELQAAVRIAGPGKIACNQVLYHVQERAIEHAVLPWCQEHGVALVAYSPLGSGSFPGPKSKAGRVLAKIAARHSVSPQAVALAFLLRERGTFVIPKTSNAEHARENARAAMIALAQEEVNAIDEVLPRGRPKPLPTL